MINKHSLVKDKLVFFNNYSREVQDCTGKLPAHYFVTVRPEERSIQTLPVIGAKYVPELNAECNRLDFVEELLRRIIYRVQSELIRKPKRGCCRQLLIRSRNDIESETRYGNEDIHHSHGVWAIHPDVDPAFQKLLAPTTSQYACNALLDVHNSGDKLFLTERMYVPLKNLIHSVNVEPCSYLEPLIEYSTKHFLANDTVNSWGTFDTPTFKEN